MATHPGESASSIQVAGLTVPAGTRQTGFLSALELADGTAVRFPLMVVRGARPGPTLYVGAAIHGDEINGVEIVYRVARTVDPAALAGTLLAVPVQSPLGLQSQHRFPLGLVLKSPLDQMPADMWAAFPGNRAGNSTEILAAVLHDELMMRADVLVDLHTPTTGGRYAPFAFLPPARCGAVARRAEELARAFGADFILDAEQGIYVDDRTPHVVAARRGAVAFGVELGEGGRLEAESVERGVQGLTNLLVALAMLPGRVEPLGRQVVLRMMTALRCSRGGLLHLQAALGSELAAGQRVATVTNPFGEVVEEIVAPHAGPLVRITTFPTVTSGERVAQIGVPR
jgi:predicted deacylase